jgi:SAM-dependent methyltransferase
MDEAKDSENEQAALWNGRAGRAWVEEQQVLDSMFEPFESLLVEAVAGRSGGAVLDVGCGTGATTLAIARRLGTAGRCVGVDISEPMIAAARARADREGSPARFICADAQVHPFEAASFDFVISRFGVMFFDDSVAAFANLRRAVRTGGALRCIAWRSPGENAFMTTAERAAAPLLSNLPPRQPDAPGQFAFANPGRVSRILGESGWASIDVQPVDVACVFPERELTRYFTRFGLLAGVIDEIDAPARERVIQTVRGAFAPYVHGAEVRFTAACWLVGARNP